MVEASAGARSRCFMALRGGAGRTYGGMGSNFLAVVVVWALGEGVYLTRSERKAEAYKSKYGVIIKVRVKLGG